MSGWRGALEATLAGASFETMAMEELRGLEEFAECLRVDVQREYARRDDNRSGFQAGPRKVPSDPSSFERPGYLEKVRERPLEVARAYLELPGGDWARVSSPKALIRALLERIEELEPDDPPELLERIEELEGSVDGILQALDTPALSELTLDRLAEEIGADLYVYIPHVRHVLEELQDRGLLRGVPR